jgi:hypothetical protein
MSLLLSAIKSPAVRRQRAGGCPWLAALDHSRRSAGLVEAMDLASRPADAFNSAKTILFKVGSKSGQEVFRGVSEPLFGLPRGLPDCPGFQRCPGFCFAEKKISPSRKTAAEFASSRGAAHYSLGQ